MPITADDYLFAALLAHDPAPGGDPAPFDLISQVKKADDHTLTIVWKAANAAFQNDLWLPLPVHSYNVGQYSGVYDAAMQTIRTDLAHQLIQDPLFTQARAAFPRTSLSHPSIQPKQRKH